VKLHAQVWLSPTIIADLIRWERSQGYISPRLASSLSNLLTILRDSLQKQFSFTPFISEAEALDYLAQCGIISTVRSKKFEGSIQTVVEVSGIPDDAMKIAQDLYKIIGEEVK
jgi:hypothetical protein